MNLHPDFDLPWCKTILTAPTVQSIDIPQRKSDGPIPPGLGVSLFIDTLYTDQAIRAHINFRRPTKEADAISSLESCSLLSLGTGIDGKKGRAHGGFNSLVIDHMTGMVAAQESGTMAPATATMTVDYKAPIDTPGVILCRSWLVETSGRKNWVKATIEDGNGKVLALGKALFISARDSKV